MSVLDGVRLAVGTLTIVPTGRVEVTRRSAAVAMIIAPAAVLPLAVPVALVGWLGTRLAAPPFITAILVLAVIALGTRALHLDGLADTVDGLGAGGDRDRALTVMRRGDVGPMGVVALILMLGLQAAAAAQVLGSPHGWVVVTVLVCVSRGALPLACSRPVRPARDSGLGAAVIGTVGLPLALVVQAALLIISGLVVGLVGTPAWQGVLAWAAAAAVVLIMIGWCTRRLCGLTGDVLGAAVELALATVLIGITI